MIVDYDLEKKGNWTMSTEKKELLELAKKAVAEGSCTSLKQAELYIKLAELHF